MIVTDGLALQKAHGLHLICHCYNMYSYTSRWPHRYIICISYNKGKSALPDIYA